MDFNLYNPLVNLPLPPSDLHIPVHQAPIKSIKDSTRTATLTVAVIRVELNYQYFEIFLLHLENYWICVRVVDDKGKIILEVTLPLYYFIYYKYYQRG